jgi:hypothetical protein
MVVCMSNREGLVIVLCVLGALLGLEHSMMTVAYPPKPFESAQPVLSVSYRYASPCYEMFGVLSAFAKIPNPLLRFAKFGIQNLHLMCWQIGALSDFKRCSCCASGSCP